MYANGRQSGGPAPEGLFLEVVDDERARSERYNHYFSVVLLRADSQDAAELLRSVRSQLRGSDIVGMVLPGGEYVRERAGGGRPQSLVDWTGIYGAVGILLPETDREGARIALSRIVALLNADESVKVGCAVYPEDSTDAGELLARASESSQAAGPGLLPPGPGAFGRGSDAWT